MGYDVKRSYEMFARAEKVIPGGIHGTRGPHFAAYGDFPAFVASAEGSRITDVDRNEYVDWMCAYGPNVLGYGHHAVQAAIVAQYARGNAMTMPSERTVELAELLTARWDFADWAMFGKNGSDVTTLATRLARAATGRAKILVQRGAYHGFDTWCVVGGKGVPAGHRADIVEYAWNDPASVHAAFDANRGEVAGLLMCPIKHDAMHDIESPDGPFLDAIRERIAAERALLMIDDVRCGFRLHPSGASHKLWGLEPDVVCFGKAISNGEPLSVLVGRGALLEAAKECYFSATHFFAAVPKAAAIATIGAYDAEGAFAKMQATGESLRAGIVAAAQRAGVAIRYTGPTTMPNLLFDADPRFKRGRRFSGLAARRGVILHPRHNWFVSAAHTADDVEKTVAVASECFRLVAEEVAAGRLD
jgi:glutamate-1-semialdehyde 2,1-aminomutase